MTEAQNPAIKATKKAARKTKKVVAKNPATTTGSVGVVLLILGRWFGWDAQMQADIATLFLILVPAIRGAVWWWEHRNEEPEEV